jgi:hypothetical protein
MDACPTSRYKAGMNSKMHAPAFLAAILLLAPLAHAQPQPPAPAAGTLVKEESDLFDFTYGWPDEAKAIPALNEELQKDLEETRASLAESAAADREILLSEGLTYRTHSFRKLWEKSGETDRLLSLFTEVSTYTGGAHPNGFYNTILWDKEAGAKIALFDLFTDRKKATGAVGAAYCPALDVARSKRREDPLPLEGSGWLVECPTLENYEIVPIDGDKNGRFETLRVLVPASEAGAYAEGAYEVDVPVTAALKSLMKPEYRGSF